MRLKEQIIAPTQEAFPVKKLSTKQSRRKITQRKTKVAARHAQAGHWSAQAQPMFGSGKVHYEVGGNMEAMSYGGIAPVHRLVTKLGLRADWSCQVNCVTDLFSGVLAPDLPREWRIG